jgi:hypothetical protein
MVTNPTQIESIRKFELLGKSSKVFWPIVAFAPHVYLLLSVFDSTQIVGLGKTVLLRTSFSSIFKTSALAIS